MCAVNLSIRLGFTASAPDRDHELKIRKPTSPCSSMCLARCKIINVSDGKVKLRFLPATVTVYITTDRIQQTFVFLFLDANIGVTSGGYFVHICRYRDQCVPPLIWVNLLKYATFYRVIAL